MNSKRTIATFKWVIFLGLALAAKGALADGTDATQSISLKQVHFEFSNPEPAGIETDRLQNRLDVIKVRGWHMARHAFFGQTRVADRNGFGFVYQNGSTVYQLNNRGIRVTRFF